MATCRTHARDNATRLAANRTYHAGRIETKNIEHVSEIKASCFHFDRRVVDGKLSRWCLLRSNGEICDGSSLREVRHEGSGVSHRLRRRKYGAHPVVHEFPGDEDGFAAFWVVLDVRRDRAALDYVHRVACGVDGAMRVEARDAA